MRNLRSRLFNVQRGERGVLAVFVVLMAANAISLEGAYVVGASGFLKNLQVEQFPILWFVDMLFILAVSGLYSLIIDRLSRLKLIRRMVLGLAAMHLLFRLLFACGAPAWLIYPGLYLLAEQQYTVFPLTFWALASDRFSVAQSKRLFPLIAGGGLVGSIIGSGLAAVSAQLFASAGIHPSEVLTLNALILISAYGLLVFSARSVILHTRRAGGRFNVREMLSTGFDFVSHVPSFRYLALSMLGVGFILIVVEYHFMVVSDQTFSSALEFQVFFGVYRMTLALVALVVQGALTGWLLKRIGLKNSLMILPPTLLAALGWMLAVPGMIGAGVGRFIGRLILVGINYPANHSLRGLIPEEQRGRVSTFMDSYVYVIGTMVGSAMLITIVLAARLGWIADVSVTSVYLALAFVVAIATVRLVWRMRAVYDVSLLDWRLARRRRRGSKFVDGKLGALIGDENDS